MSAVKKLQIGIISLSIVMFGCGLFLWLQAHFYQPQTTEAVPYRQGAIRENTEKGQSGPYQALRNGTLFFDSAAPVRGEKPPFQSKLVLWGITGGKNGCAVVGFNPKSNAQTVIVKVGEQIAGETVTAIGKDFIVVRNETGEGEVRL